MALRESVQILSGVSGGNFSSMRESQMAANSALKEDAGQLTCANSSSGYPSLWRWAVPAPISPHSSEPVELPSVPTWCLLKWAN
eukprot:3250666-Rhodomonas_salina.4